MVGWGCSIIGDNRSLAASFRNIFCATLISGLRRSWLADDLIWLLLLIWSELVVAVVELPLLMSVDETVEGEDVFVDEFRWSSWMFRCWMLVRCSCLVMVEGGRLWQALSVDNIISSVIWHPKNTLRSPQCKD